VNPDIVSVTPGFFIGNSRVIQRKGKRTIRFAGSGIAQNFCREKNSVRGFCDIRTISGIAYQQRSHNRKPEKVSNPIYFLNGVINWLILQQVRSIKK
jgi:hypothetical protein